MTLRASSLLDWGYIHKIETLHVSGYAKGAIRIGFAVISEQKQAEAELAARNFVVA